MLPMCMDYSQGRGKIYKLTVDFTTNKTDLQEMGTHKLTVVINTVLTPLLEL